MKQFRSVCTLLLTALLCLTCFGGCVPAENNDAGGDPLTVDGVTYVDTDSATNYVKIIFKDYGTVLVQLSPEDAPLTVANFQLLVGNGFYDGLTIHRVEKDFVIQGGAPKDNTRPATIRGEFSANGFTNNLSHKRGVLSMARLGTSYDSASSQFFVCLDTFNCTYALDGRYAAFGWVLSGMDVIDAIADVETKEFTSGSTTIQIPTKTITIQSMSFVTPQAPQSESVGESEAESGGETA